LYGLKGIRTFC